MPTPKDGESQKDYMSRCMAYPDMQDLEQDARFAKCNGMWEQAHKEKNMSEEIRDLKNVEIFETGNHKGDDYTEKDLDDMVECFNETKTRLKPFVKLGHNPSQVLLQQDGLPAAGWITGLKRAGGKLVADFSAVPRKIADLIEKKAYGRFSSEIFWNGKIDNKTYRRGVRAVALLGGDTPAVQTLNDFINLYTDNSFECETMKIYDDEDTQMADSKEFMETFEKQIKDYSEKLEDAKKKEVQLTVQITNLEGQIKELKTKIDMDEKSKLDAEKQAKENEIKMFIDAQVKDLRIAPARVEFYTELARKDFNSVKELVKDLPKITDPDVKSKNVDKKTDKTYTEMDAQEKEDYIDEQVKKYSDEKKISYTDAYIEFMSNLKEE